MGTGIVSRAGRLAALLVSASLMTGAHAARVGISPTRAVLTPERRVETLTLRNPGDVAVDFQVAVKQWRQQADGEWLLDDLQAGDALVVFPLSFRIEPGRQQVIRIGLNGPPAPGPERAYRLLVRELPGERKPDGDTRLGVLGQMSLPVFVNDGKTAPEIRMDSGAISRGTWRFRVSVAGNGHLDPSPAHVKLYDAADRLLLEHAAQINYVLSGVTLEVPVPLAGTACANAVRYVIDANAPLGRQQGVLPPAGGRSCGS